MNTFKDYFCERKMYDILKAKHVVLFTSVKEVMFQSCLSVWLLAGYLKTLQTDFSENWWEGWT